MDDDISRSRGPATGKTGGTVEPANRAEVAKALFQTPRDMPPERYELQDPFAEVTYRSSRISEILAKADQLGSDRFVALEADGKRTTVQRVQGEAGTIWVRGPQRPAGLERPLDPLPARDEVPHLTDIERADKAAQPPRVAAAVNSDRVHAAEIARLDTEAERAALRARLEAGLMERYVIKRRPVIIGDVSVGGTEYRFRGDTARIAFTESTFRLATDTNSPSVARSMVDVAEAREWRSLRVSGNEDFRRMVWLEASVRGVKTLGYEPDPSDLELLKRERDARLVNRIEPGLDATKETASRPAGPASTSEKGSARGGGRKAVIEAIEAVLVAKRVPQKQRQAVIAAAAEKLAQRVRAGQAPKVKIYDKGAPPQRPIAAPLPELQRTRERAAPVR